ncbi:MAG: hypothetical protein C0394_08155 [Syntrophus sp. (in: bacteria)]|nr:hypothetical protein [Syntrophus sp. (in: bacteria)]
MILIKYQCLKHLIRINGNGFIAMDIFATSCMYSFILWPINIQAFQGRGCNFGHTDRQIIRIDLIAHSRVNYHLLSLEKQSALWGIAGFSSLYL